MAGLGGFEAIRGIIVMILQGQEGLRLIVVMLKVQEGMGLRSIIVVILQGQECLRLRDIIVVILRGQEAYSCNIRALGLRGVIDVVLDG